MNPRERETAVIMHRIPDRIPVDCMALEVGGKDMGDDPLLTLGIDGRIISPYYKGPLSAAEEETHFTEWQTPAAHHYGTKRYYPLTGISTVAEIEKFCWPDPLLYDYKTAAEAAAGVGKYYAARGPAWNPLFCRICDLFGMEEAMVKMVSEPAVFESALERVFAITAELCERFLNACGSSLTCLYLGDDFATQRGLMFSAGMWRKFLKCRYRRIFDIGKKHGKFIWFHSCGDITAVLPDMIDIGLDVWETVQIHTLPLTPVRLKKEYGKYLTFFGGISTQSLPFLTVEEVRKEVVRTIEQLGEDGGYICGPDHHVKPDVPLQNVITLFKTARSFRKQGFTSACQPEVELTESA